MVYCVEVWGGGGERIAATEMVYLPRKSYTKLQEEFGTMKTLVIRDAGL